VFANFYSKTIAAAFDRVSKTPTFLSQANWVEEKTSAVILAG
jgi:hypothetical protein